MELAAQHLNEIGYQCQDTSNNKSYDFLARKNDVVIKVEVKGTTSDLCDSIMMTKNEVDLHRREKGSTALIIVSGIKLLKSENGPLAINGEVEALMQWDIDQWISSPIAYQVTRLRS